MQFAGDDPTVELYRFMPYPSDGDGPAENMERRRRVEALIAEGEMYFPTPPQLNDPFEARPHYAPLHSETEAYRAACRDTLHRQANTIGFTEEMIREAESRIATWEPQSDVDRLAAMWHAKSARLPMASFASNRDHILMWSYYAGGHTGVAIKFDSTENSIFGGATKVTYSSTYPHVEVPLQIDQPELLKLSLLTKSLHWQHEGEYRLLGMPLHLNEPEHGTVLDRFLTKKADRLYTVPVEQITGITLGAAMNRDLRDRLREIAARRNPELPVWQASCDATDYKIVFARL